MYNITLLRFNHDADLPIPSSLILSTIYRYLAKLFLKLMRPGRNHRGLTIFSLLIVFSLLASILGITPSVTADFSRNIFGAPTSGSSNNNYRPNASVVSSSSSNTSEQSSPSDLTTTPGVLTATETSLVGTSTSTAISGSPTSAFTSTAVGTSAFTSTPAATSTASSISSPIATGTSTSTSTPTATIVGTPPLTYTIGLPTPAPSLTPIPDTNYADQAIESSRNALIDEINALPALTQTITGTLVTGLDGGQITSTDGILALGMRPGVVPMTDTINVRITSPTFQQGDPRASRGGQPLAYTFELTATNALSGEPVTHFGKDAVLVWNVEPSVLSQAGIKGTYRVYTFNEQSQQWEEVLSRWDPATNQLLITTPHFSLYGVGDGFDKVNNYVPTLNDFEMDLQSGSASINYPINVPAGPAGFGPKVSLSYSSSNVDRVDAGQQGSSSVGWGWSLSGSYIAATQHYFGSNNPWTASIAIDGVNGDLVKGSDGRWHTSIESFTRIEYVQGSGGNRATDSWEAWDKSGTHYVFNLNALLCDEYNGRHATTGTPVCPYDSRWDLTTYKWMLSSATDVYGNTITYSYKYQTNIGTLVTAPITTDRTKSVYPSEINYGTGGDKLKVVFDVVGRTINSTTDVSYSDSGGNLYQNYRIDRIEVQRKQQLSGSYQLLRAYDLLQNYDIRLGTIVPPATVPPNPHLTLAAIRSWGNDNATQLPDTAFQYVQYDNTNFPQDDWGHVWWAYNGYGGEVGYYYDAAGSDVNRSYRRVRAKKVGDGLGTNPPHRVTYYYDYHGAQTNTTNISSDAAVTTNPLDLAGGQFRGYAWVREQDPSGQMTDHYFQQDDYFKAKEWRVQVGKAPSFTDTMSSTPTTTADWTVSSGVVSYWDPKVSTNNTWKVPNGSSIARNVGVTDSTGSDVAARFFIRHTVDDATIDPQLTANWRLETGSGSTYQSWGVRIYSRRDNPTGIYRFYARAVWNVNNVEYVRELGPVSNTLVPQLKRDIIPNEWYWVKLHVSPDGRFVAEIYQDDHILDYPGGTRTPELYGNYVQIKSGDSTSSGTIPTFPLGLTWKFKHDVTSTSSSAFFTLADDYSETRTLYQQSDTWHTARVISYPTPNLIQPLVGLENNCNGMGIQFLFANRTESTTYGAACCQLGQTKRSRTEYDYDTLGNQYLVDEYGDITTTGDERETLTSYVNVDRPTVSPPQYFVGKVGHTDTYQYLPGNPQYQFVARTQNYYDYQTTAESIPSTTSGLGRLTKSEQLPILGGVENGTRINRQFAYDSYGNQTSVTDPNGNQSTTGYDTYYNSFPMTSTLPTGRSEYTYWDYTVDMPKETKDQNGTFTEFRYDVFGRPEHNWTIGYGSDTTPNQRYGFNDLAHVTVTPPFYISYTVQLGTQAGSNDTAWQMRWYDGRGRTVQDVSPKDSTNSNLILTDTGYNDLSQVMTATLPYTVSVTSRFAYSTPDTSKPKMIKLYDGAGRPVEMQNPDYNPTTNPNSHIINDYNWLLWSGTLDESGHYKWQRSDMLGRMDMVKEQDVIATPTTLAYTTYTYDMLNHLTQVTRDSGGSLQTTSSTMTYEGLGRKASMTDTDMGNWQYVYDAAGNLTQQKDALYLSNPTMYADHQVFFKYDNMNRILEKYYGATHWNNGTGGTPDVKYYYDDAFGDASTKYSWGKLRAAEVTLQGQGSDKANVHRYAYDTRGLLISEVVTTTLSTRSAYTTTYAYDTAGRMYQTTYPDPESTHETVTTHYNAQGIDLPDQLTSSITTSNPVPVQSATYNQRGQMLTLVQGTTTPSNNQLTTSYTYDDSTTKRGWLTNTLVQAGSSNTTILDLSQGYTLNGNISSVTQNSTDTGNVKFNNTFLYDGLDRLTKATSQSGSGYTSIFPEEEYTFDRLDRMDTRKLNTTWYSVDYADPAHKDAPTGYNGEQYGYDANGNQTIRNTTSTNLNQTRFFDPEGRVSQIISDTSTTNLTVTDFIYDANGQRLIKSVSTVTPTPVTPTATNTRTATGTNTPTSTATRTPTNTATPCKTCGGDSHSGKGVVAVPGTGPKSGTGSIGQTGPFSGGSSYLCEGAAWTNKSGVTSTANMIEKTSGIDGWNAGASSTSSLPLGSNGYTRDGYMQTVAVSRNHHTIFGLSNGDQNQNYTDIDYAIHLQGQVGGWPGDLVIYEAGSEKYRISSTSQNPAYVAGDILNVSVEGGYVKYYKNGSLLYTSTTRPTTSLVVDTSLFDIGGQIKEVYLCRTAPTTTPQRTLYIGSLYEEELPYTAPDMPDQPSGVNPAYTSYYSFGGKMVGMRRANYTTGGNGQYRMVTDHLGSSTLVVDTASPPSVVAREYHKPYGEVAWSGGSSTMTSLTTVGYTGQRLDTDSGLMYYGARFYDPLLSSFVSADTASPDVTDPKARQKYSYVLNGPLKYTDPSGHDPCNTQECKKEDAKKLLGYYGFIVQKDQCGWFGVNVDGCIDFNLQQLEWMIDAIHDFMRVAKITDVDVFKRLLGTDKTPITLRNMPGAAQNYTLDANTITLTADRDQLGGQDIFKSIFIHELAHAWNYRSNYELEDEMHDENFDSHGQYCAQGGSAGGVVCNEYADRSKPKPGRAPTSDYGNTNRDEDFAEAVTATVYPGVRYVGPGGKSHGDANTTGTASSRKDFVLRKMHGLP